MIDFVPWHEARGPGRHGAIPADLFSLGPRPRAPGPLSRPRAPGPVPGPRVFGPEPRVPAPVPGPVAQGWGPGAGVRAAANYCRTQIASIHIQFRFVRKRIPPEGRRPRHAARGPGPGTKSPGPGARGPGLGARGPRSAKLLPPGVGGRNLTGTGRHNFREALKCSPGPLLLCSGLSRTKHPLQI